MAASASAPPPTNTASPAAGGIGGSPLSKRTGSAVVALPVHMGDLLMLVTDGGQLIRIQADAVRITGRQGMGVMLMRLAEGERVISCFPVSDEDEGGEDAQPEETADNDE